MTFHRLIILFFHYFLLSSITVISVVLVHYREGLVEEFSSAGIVPYIGESKVKCAVLLLAVVFLVTGGFFVAFKSKVVSFWGLCAAGRA